MALFTPHHYIKLVGNATKRDISPRTLGKIYNDCVRDKSLGLSDNVWFDLTNCGNILKTIEHFKFIEGWDGCPKTTARHYNYFMNTVKTGDTMLIAKGSQGAKYLVQITSDCYYNPNWDKWHVERYGPYFHRRDFRIICKFEKDIETQYPMNMQIGSMMNNPILWHNFQI